MITIVQSPTMPSHTPLGVHLPTQLVKDGIDGIDTIPQVKDGIDGFDTIPLVKFGIDALAGLGGPVPTHAPGAAQEGPGARLGPARQAFVATWLFHCHLYYIMT